MWEFITRCTSLYTLMDVRVRKAIAQLINTGYTFAFFLFLPVPLLRCILFSRSRCILHNLSWLALSPARVMVSFII